MAKRADKPQAARSGPSTVAVLPVQLRPGDTFTDEGGAWEVVGRPTTERGGKQVKANVEELGDPNTHREKWWPAYERVRVTRPSTVRSASV